VVGGVVLLQRQVDERIDRVPRRILPAGVLDPSTLTYPMTILVVGSDSRAFVSNAQEAQTFGSATDQSGQRADVMMLVRLTATGVTVVSLPRDLLVDDHGTSRQLNSFFDHGPAALIDAIKTNLDVQINHYVQVDFRSFIKVVDAAGGLRMNVPAPIRDTYSGLDVAVPGCTNFDGDRALAFVRSRHLEAYDGQRWIDRSGAGDLDRIHRQQMFLQDLLAKTKAQVGADLGSVQRMADAVISSLTVDSQLGRGAIADLVHRFVQDDPATWTFLTLPVGPAPNDPNRLVTTGPLGDALFAPIINRGIALLPDPHAVPAGLGDPC
ncbi:MAG: LCP family protein, partial [Acidimicrobiia bacterium]